MESVTSRPILARGATAAWSRDDIHGTALVAAARDVEQHLIGLLGVHPVVGGAGVLFLAGADEGAAFHTGHVVDGGAVQVAARQLLLVELDHLAGGAGFFAQLFQLLLRAIDPHDLVGVDQLFHFVEPSQHGLVVGHCDYLLSPNGKIVQQMGTCCPVSILSQRPRRINDEFVKLVTNTDAPLPSGGGGGQVSSSPQ